MNVNVVKKKSEHKFFSCLRLIIKERKDDDDGGGGKSHGNLNRDACFLCFNCVVFSIWKMNKKSLNDTVFTIQGVNPGFTTREEASNQPSQPTPGKVVLKRFYIYFNVY